MTKTQLAQHIVKGMYGMEKLPDKRNPNVRNMAEGRKKAELERFYGVIKKQDAARAIA
jgi:hypothetical protein